MALEVVCERLLACVLTGSFRAWWPKENRTSTRRCRCHQRFVKHVWISPRNKVVWCHVQQTCNCCFFEGSIARRISHSWLDCIGSSMDKSWEEISHTLLHLASTRLLDSWCRKHTSWFVVHSALQSAHSKLLRVHRCQAGSGPNLRRKDRHWSFPQRPLLPCSYFWMWH